VVWQFLNLLRNIKLNSYRIWSTTQLYAPHPPPPATHCLYILYVYFGGGRGEGGQREGRGATVHKSGRKYQHDWLYLQSINSIKTPVKTTIMVFVFIVPSSMTHSFRHEAYVFKGYNTVP
jgi:hypothetical protein